MSDAPKHSVSVAGIVLGEGGSVLAVQRRDNARWEPPGGVLELDETFEEGVQREVFEETGVQVSVDRLTGVYKNLSLGVVALVFRCIYVSGDPIETAEARKVKWISRAEIETHVLPVYAVRFLDALTDHMGVAVRTHDGIQLKV